MRANDFDKMTSQGGYRKIGMFPVVGGQAYLAEKIVHEDEMEYVTLWAAGPDGENLEIAQHIHFKWGTPRDMRENHALQKAREFLALRDYRGDPNRR